MVAETCNWLQRHTTAAGLRRWRPQDRLLWKYKTCPASTELIMSWKANSRHYCECVIITVLFTITAIVVDWGQDVACRCLDLHLYGLY